MLPTHVKQSAGLGIAVVFLLITPVPAQRPQLVEEMGWADLVLINGKIVSMLDSLLSLKIKRR